MKKLFVILLLISVFVSSCYIDDDYYCNERINYNNYTINKFYSPAIVKVNFYLFCPQNNGYYLLVQDNNFGTEFINGRWWTIVTPMFFNTPITTYVDYNFLYPYRNYRCIILSTSGAYSQEFNLSTY